MNETSAPQYNRPVGCGMSPANYCFHARRQRFTLCKRAVATFSGAERQRRSRWFFVRTSDKQIRIDCENRQGRCSKGDVLLPTCRSSTVLNRTIQRSSIWQFTPACTALQHRMCTRPKMYQPIYFVHVESGPILDAQVCRSIRSRPAS